MIITQTRQGNVANHKQVQASHFLVMSVFICGKGRKKYQRRQENLVKCQTRSAEDAIKKAGQQRQDKLFYKIQDFDLVAREAHYQNSCRRAYTRAWERNQKECTDKEAVEEHRAHDSAFQYIIQYLQLHIIEQCNVERTTMLAEKYQQFMLENHSEFYNKNY